MEETIFRGAKFAFKVVADLSVGGMGRVYLGTREDDPSVKVAIKTPLPDLSPEHRGLFLREAEAALRVANPRVVSVIDWGSEPPFIAFEFVEGGTLDRELRRRAADQDPWGERELLGLYRQLVAALAAINAEVIHRDLKPANVFYNPQGEIKVGDFGIAKYVGQLTRTGSFKGWGSLPYKAPETIRGDSVDWRSDQYSLGIVFFEMATFQLPFSGTHEELEKKHLYSRPARLTQVGVPVSERLATVVAKMLEKRTDARFASWEVLNAELAAILDANKPEQSVGREDPLAAVAARQIEAVEARSLGRERQEDERRRRIRDREELLEFWSGEFFASIRSRVDALNKSLDGRIKVQSPAPRLGPCSIEVAFLHGSISIEFEALPLEAPDDMLAWGNIFTRTNRRGWMGNIYLGASPPPYGTWFEVEMNIHPMMQRAMPTDTEGGTYDLLNDDHVLASNWRALACQRSKKGNLSLVEYREKHFDFAAVMSECFTIFIEDAALEPEPRR